MLRMRNYFGVDWFIKVAIYVELVIVALLNAMLRGAGLLRT